MQLQHLKLSWWNTALSSAAKKANSNLIQCIEALSYIEELLNDFNCDLVALSEVCSDDLTVFDKLLPDNYKVLDITNKAGKTRFDCAVIYNENAVDIVEVKDLNLTDLNNTVKAGQVLKVTEKVSNDEFTLVLCHWSSQIMTSGINKRENAAKYLKFYLEDVLHIDGKVIVMGDFNDEPHSRSMLENLYASRCIDAVRKHPKELLYNPFWRHMVSTELYSYTTPKSSYESGTHNFQSYSKNFWHMYDQILFSASFLGASEWHINEKETKVVKSPSLTTAFTSKSSFIDHYPVICEIQKP
jgi:exonuclease III